MGDASLVLLFQHTADFEDEFEVGSLQTGKAQVSGQVGMNGYE
jgi:hypothetical protein